MKRTTKAYSLNIKNLIIASTEEFAKVENSQRDYTPQYNTFNNMILGIITIV